MHSLAMRWDIDAAVADAAKRYEGAFRRETAYEAGADRTLFKRRVDRGRWIVKGGDVLVLAGWPDTHAQRCWIALLAAGEPAHLSHECAAELHRIRGVRRGLVVVTVKHPLHLTVEGVLFHQLDDLRPQHLTTVGPWPVTTPARTVLDL